MWLFQVLPKQKYFLQWEYTASPPRSWKQPTGLLRPGVDACIRDFKRPCMCLRIPSLFLFPFPSPHSFGGSRCHWKIMPCGVKGWVSDLGLESSSAARSALYKLLYFLETFIRSLKVEDKSTSISVWNK